MMGQRGATSKLGQLFSRRLSSPGTPEKSCSTLEVVVMFTDVPRTLTALRIAAQLAHNLNGRIRLVAPQVVPYPLPLESPPVANEFSERRFHTLADHAPVETSVELYLCRDRDDALLQALEPESLIVIGARLSWWPTHERALARRLRREGHQVILASPERKND